MNMEDMSRFDWQGKPGVCPLELQLDVLSLDGMLLKGLRKTNARVLDIGCGEEFMLVKYLHAKGINAEGLDPRIKQGNEYLMDIGMPIGFKDKTKIMPRPNNLYDLIISHCMDYFYNKIHVLGSEDERLSIEFDNTTSGVVLSSNFAIFEALRVLKSGAEMIVYPAITSISRMQKEFEQRKCSFEQQPLGEEKVSQIKTKYWEIYSWFEEPIKRGDYRYRTIIHKN